MTDRDCLLQLFVWLIEAGYVRDSKEVELILRQLQVPADQTIPRKAIYSRGPQGA